MTERQKHLLEIMADPVNYATSLGKPDRAAIDAALVRIAELEEAIKPFADMSSWLEALVEVGEIDPMKEHAAVFQIMGGGSNAITVGDLRRAARALAGKDTL